MILLTSLHEKITGLKATSSVHPDEGARLSYLASRVPNGGVIVELGSFLGRSACYMAAGLKETNITAKIYCVDLWEKGVTTRDSHHSIGAFPRFERNLKSCGLYEYIHPVQSDTVAAARDWHTPIDLLHIDAGHKYEEVLGDYRAWSPFVKPGGVIAFHDYHHIEIANCIQENVIPSGLWDFISLYNRIWTARRRAHE